MFILHGDHETALYTEISSQLEKAKKEGRDIVRLDGKKLTIFDLERALGTDALFANKKLVIIERFLSSTRSKAKDALIAFIQKLDNPETEIVFVEPKILTALQLKAFPKAIQKQFKYPPVLFTWIESIGIKNRVEVLSLFHTALEQEDAYICFAMLIRQVRILLSFKDGSYAGPPFLRAKVDKQARGFSLEKLLHLHTRLLEIDEGEKTSTSSLSLPQNLDLLLAEL
jgi:DNA polymerase III delta subunit